MIQIWLFDEPAWPHIGYEATPLHREILLLGMKILGVIIVGFQSDVYLEFAKGFDESCDESKQKPFFLYEG